MANFVENLEVDTEAQQMFEEESEIIEDELEEEIMSTPESINKTTPVTEIDSTILKLAYQFTTKEGTYSSFFLTSNNVVTTDKSILFIGDCSINKQTIPNGTVAAADVYKLLQVCKNNTLKWQDLDNSILATTNTFEYKIPKIYTLEIPSAQLLFDERFTNSIKEDIEITDEVLTGLEAIQFCSIPDTNPDKLALQGISFESNYLYSSDAYSLASYKVSTKVKTPFILPIKLSLFMTHFGLPPESCTLIKIPSKNNSAIITNSYILVTYKKFKLLCCLSPLKFPETVKNTFDDFTSTHTLNFENLTFREKKEITTKLSIVQENAVTLKRKKEGSLLLTVVDAIGYQVTEEIPIDIVSNLNFSFMTGLNFFNAGFLKASLIQINKSQNQVQLLFVKDNFSYLILGSVKN